MAVAYGSSTRSLESRRRDGDQRDHGRRRRRAAVSKPHDGKAVCNGATLAGTPRSVWIISDVGRLAPGAQQGLGAGERVELLGTFRDVALKEQLSAGYEKPSNLPQEIGGGDETLPLPLLPPRIREVEKHGTNGSGAKPLEREACVFGEHATTRPETAFAEPAVDDGRPLETDLEADHARLRRSFETVEKEPAAAGAYLDLHWPLAAGNERARVDVLAFREPRGICVAENAWHGARR